MEQFCWTFNKENQFPFPPEKLLTYALKFWPLSNTIIIALESCFPSSFYQSPFCSTSLLSGALFSDTSKIHLILVAISFILTVWRSFCSTFLAISCSDTCINVHSFHLTKKMKEGLKFNIFFFSVHYFLECFSISILRSLAILIFPTQIAQIPNIKYLLLSV